MAAQAPERAEGFRLPVKLFALVGCICLVLFACQKTEEVPRNYSLLAANAHVSVADYHMVLPFIALDDYRARQSFSLNRTRDRANQAHAIAQLMSDTGNPAKPKPFDRLSLEIRTYGWNDGDMQQRKICPLLTREWARSACDNPWAALQQSLPERIELVDLSRLRLTPPEPRVPRCAMNGSPRQAFPTRLGDTVLLCELEIGGGRPGQFYVALVRIDGDLGAAWSVWRGSQSGETVETMAARQGKAIVALVRHGLGVHEDFARLDAVLCGLRAPNSQPGKHHLDCGSTVSP